MSFLDQLKSTFNVSNVSDPDVSERPGFIPATGLPLPKDGVISIATNPGTPVSEPEEDKSAWSSFVGSMENARKRATVMFTGDVADPHPVLVSAPVPEDSTIAAAVSSWWTEAASLMQEAKISVEEKWTEIVGAEEIKNDPLRRLREQLGVYEEALEQLKTEAYTFALCGESFTRIGSQGLENAIGECFDQRGHQSVGEQYAQYKRTHQQVVAPIIEQVRDGVQHVTDLISEEIGKLHALQARYIRRDRLHRNLMDQRTRVANRRDRDNKKRLEGGMVDAKSLEELYEMSRTMDAIESDFRLTSEQVIASSHEILLNRSKTFHGILSRLVEVQNAFMYRVGHSCSIPFQELLENMKESVPLEDNLEDLGSHPLTWRSSRRGSSDEVEMKPAPPASHYAYARKSKTTTLDEAPSSPERNN